MSATIKLRKLSLSKGAAFFPLKLLVEASDSQGEQVDLSKISTEGLVNTQEPGNYPVLFKFIDSHTGESIKAMTMVTVTE